MIVAGMGFVAALLSAWLGARLQRKSDRDVRMLEARLRVYGECADSLYEYSRATYSRAKSRLAGRPEVERDQLRQAAYHCNARVRSAIGQAYILTGDLDLERRLSTVRRTVGTYNGVSDPDELKGLQQQAYREINDALEAARRHLVA
ncbi:UNVERIFIED_CONTAM: hypothetical protein LK11_32645 [Mumia flava]